MVTFDDFKKLEIRIGKIISSEKVEGADKLLKLEVDFGEIQSQLIAGIAQYYKPEELVNKEIPVLVNLEPRRIKGIESQGMLLAVVEGKKPILLHPDREVLPGSMIK